MCFRLIALLNIQVSMHEASQPGGILEHMKWWQFSITNHDFLLAAMIMCLDLNTNQRVDPRSGQMCYCAVAERAKLDALLNARDIWGKIAGECIDAKRAVGILSSLIRRLTVKVENDAVLNSNPDPIEQPPSFTSGLGVGASSNTNIPMPITSPEMGDPLYMSMIPENMFDTGGIFGTSGGQVDVPRNLDWASYTPFVL